MAGVYTEVAIKHILDEVETIVYPVQDVPTCRMSDLSMPGSATPSGEVASLNGCSKKGLWALCYLA